LEGICTATNRAAETGIPGEVLLRRGDGPRAYLSLLSHWKGFNACQMSSSIHSLPGLLADSSAHGKTERLLTISDMAAWLGVSKGWVYDHTTRKRPFLPCVRLGEMTRFRRDDIQKFIEEHTNDNGGPH
jgi:excisionase family DNA binding protein